MPPEMGMETKHGLCAVVFVSREELGFIHGSTAPRVDSRRFFCSRLETCLCSTEESCPCRLKNNVSPNILVSHPLVASCRRGSCERSAPIRGGLGESTETRSLSSPASSSCRGFFLFRIACRDFFFVVQLSAVVATVAPAAWWWCTGQDAVTTRSIGGLRDQASAGALGAPSVFACLHLQLHDHHPMIPPPHSRHMAHGRDDDYE